MSGPEFVASVGVCEADKVTLALLRDRLASDRFEPLHAGAAGEALGSAAISGDLLVDPARRKVMVGEVRIAKKSSRSCGS